MKIDDVIEFLSDSSTSLSSGMLKARVFFATIKNNEVDAWLKKEMDGYEEGDPLPSYRIILSSPKGNISNGVAVNRNVNLSILEIPDSLRSAFITSNVRNSVQFIEAMAEKRGNGLGNYLSPEACYFLSEALSDGWFVLKAWLPIDHARLDEILYVIRGKLLGFLLDVKALSGNSDTSEDVGKAQDSGMLDIKGAFSNAVIGDNATFIIGNENTQNVQITVSRRDREGLRKLFKSNGADDSEIKGLDEAIDADEADSANGSDDGSIITAQTDAYLALFKQKAVHGLTNVSVKSATGLLVAGVKAYFGSS